MQLRQRLLIPAVKAFVREKLRFSFLSALPVIFDMTNGPMELDRSLEDSYGLTMEEVQHYVSLIRTLEPYPTAALSWAT